ncbi:hypothetical protein TWF481_000725 [Arthrobotrys musiformis]|uniref:F-box domain-containing protein n=1 Tax=Arthrobotrys musiformis TaxID=47236 RepID=A0AAV9WPB1_9PEZI
MGSRLLLLPKELREEILSYVLEPNIIFYFRDSYLADSDSEDEDDRDDIPDILVSHEIGPVPPSLLRIHPIITEDIQCIFSILLPKLHRIIEENMQEADDDDYVLWNKCFVPEPSESFLELAKSARFVLDLTVRSSTDALEMISISSSLANSIRYIAFDGFNQRLLKMTFTRCPNVETVALFAMPTTIQREIFTNPLFLLYGNYGGRAGNPRVFSKLEYIFEGGDSGREQLASTKFPDHEITMRPTCKKRKLEDWELDERGRVVFYFGADSSTPTRRDCVESTVITYEFVEPPLL